MKIFKALFILLTMSLISACSPRIEVAVPQEPIVINLNVKVKHEILLKIDKEADSIFEENEELF